MLEREACERLADDETDIHREAGIRREARQGHSSTTMWSVLEDDVARQGVRDDVLRLCNSTSRPR